MQSKTAVDLTVANKLFLNNFIRHEYHNGICGGCFFTSFYASVAKLTDRIHIMRMQEYERTELMITEFDSEDVIATSGVPQPPQDQRNVSMNSPNYEKGNGGSVNGWNWTLWQ